MPDPTANLETAQLGAPSLPVVVVIKDFPGFGSESPPASTAGDALLEADRAMVSEGAPTSKVDRLQEEEMARTSPDGRPPRHRLVAIERKWFIAVALAVGVGLALWAIGSRVAGQTLLLGAVLVLLLVGAAIPVWRSGFLRAREERAARKAALLQVRPDRTPQ